MAVREFVTRGGAAASEHTVQFFDSPESRAESAAAFLAAGHREGEPLVVIARGVNWALIIEALETLGVGVQRALAEERLIVVDAAATLRRLSPGGSPDAAAFDAAVGALVARLSAAHGRVRAYGEVVDLLAQRLEFADTIALEALWNDLAARVPVSLMCCYSAAHFVSPATHGALRDICGAHGHVHRDMQDPLADWVLASADAAIDSAFPLS